MFLNVSLAMFLKCFLRFWHFEPCVEPTYNEHQKKKKKKKKKKETEPLKLCDEKAVINGKRVGMLEILSTYEFRDLINNIR